ncbi:hypothetical protein ACJX0J_037597, partial [Zea mays]
FYMLKHTGKRSPPYKRKQSYNSLGNVKHMVYLFFLIFIKNLLSQKKYEIYKKGHGLTSILSEIERLAENRG